MGNKIYHVKRTDKVDYDEYSDYVVIAKDRKEAFDMNPGSTYCNCFDERKVTIELIGHTSKAKRLVCKSFHAG